MSVATLTQAPPEPVAFRTETKRVFAHEVQPGDRLLEMVVDSSLPHDEIGVWKIRGRTADKQHGFVLGITEDTVVEVHRTRLLGENECRACGRTGIKYSARRLCNTCYQREHRGAKHAS